MFKWMKFKKKEAVVEPKEETLELKEVIIPPLPKEGDIRLVQNKEISALTGKILNTTYVIEDYSIQKETISIGYGNYYRSPKKDGELIWQYRGNWGGSTFHSLKDALKAFQVATARSKKEVLAYVPAEEK